MIIEDVDVMAYSVLKLTNTISEGMSEGNFGHIVRQNDARCAL
jgi:hypothetical protein